MVWVVLVNGIPLGLVLLPADRTCDPLTRILSNLAASDLLRFIPSSERDKIRIKLFVDFFKIGKSP